MSLPKRPLGSSAVAITTVGFGAWAIGGSGWTYSWGRQDDDTSLATIRLMPGRKYWRICAAHCGLVRRNING
jgi:hypothetical protein